MMLVIGSMAIGGATYLLATRQPPDITMAELRDAGAADERIDRWVAVCPERITAKTRNYLKNNGYGTFGVGTYHRIARVVWEYAEADGGRTALNASLIVSLDAGKDADGGDEDDSTDNSLLYRLDDCYRVECDNADGGLNELRLLPDGGFRHMRSDGGEIPWCNVATRRGRATPPCTIPDCWVGDGGAWDDNAVVDCRGTGPFGEFPGGEPRWRGCNVTPAAYATGAACVPVECSVVAGDNPIDVSK